MRAYFLQQTESETRLELKDAPQPEPKPNQHLVRVRTASLNRGELLRGGLIKPGAAKAGGQDGAGEVVGSGERVMGRLPGSWAEYALMDKTDAIPVPASMSWEEAAAAPLAFLVTYDMLVQQGGLKAGEWLLVTGVSSGVGVSSMLAAKAMGARVIGTSRSQAKLDKLKALGLDVAIQGSGGFLKQVLEVTGGKGANLCVNNVGGSVFAETIKALAFEGRHATVGYVDGKLEAELDIEALHSKRLKLFGVSNKLRNAEQRGVTVAGFTRDWLPLFASGKLKPLVDKVYSFEDLPKAKAAMEADTHMGKLVVKVA
jgi:NADPH:quinone reductase-like Zn-dependent oxidoreductase